MKSVDWKKYLIAFFITAAIFATALYVSNFLNDKKVGELQAIESKISMDILSSETQYNLLAEASCEDIGNSVLSEELGSLSDRLSYMEGTDRKNDPELIRLKQYYSLLEIKDFLLVGKIGDKCRVRPISILYFYGNDCPDCDKEGYVLTYIRQQYPQVRVYSFDYNIGLPAVRTLASIYNVNEPLPAIVVKGKTYRGFQAIEDIERILPELKKLSANAASTTVKQK